MTRSEGLNELMRGRAVAAIQHAALESFAESGFHGGSMADIARRAGVAKGLIYNYFPSKEALLVALLRDRLREAMDTQEEPTAGSGERLLRRVERTVARATDDRDLYRVYFGLLLQPDMAPAIRRAESSLSGELAEEMRRLTGVFEDVSEQPALDMLLFQMALNGLAMMLLARPELLDQKDAFPLAALQARLVELFAQAGRRGNSAASPDTSSAPPSTAPARRRGGQRR